MFAKGRKRTMASSGRPGSTRLLTLGWQQGNGKVVRETPSQGDSAMSTMHGPTWLERTSVSTRQVYSFFWKCWDAFQEHRERQKLHAALSRLSDRELVDIGTARGEIDYIASRRGIDPRGMRSG